MSALRDARDTIARDARRPPDELAVEADRVRADVDRTLDALEHRLSPAELFEQTLGVVRRNGSELGANLTTQIRNNPLAAVMAGVGLAWLMTSSRTPPAPRYRRDGGSLGETVAAATSSARETAGSVRASAREAISTIRGTTGQLADRSEAGARRVRDGYAHLRDEQPLVLGALAVAAGAAIGAVLPRSATEDAWLGAKSDAVTARLQSEARARLEDAKADGASAIMGATDDGGESPAPGSF